MKIFATKEERIEAKAAYKAAKSEMKAATKRYKKATRARRLIVLAVFLVILSVFISGFADTIPAAEVEEMKAQLKAEDIAVLPEDAVLGDPEFVAEWDPVSDPWDDNDNERILFYGFNDSGFDAVSAAHEGFEIAKTQDCIVSTVTGNTLECTAPDGSIYTVENEYGLQIGDMLTLCFLLAAG